VSSSLITLTNAAPDDPVITVLFYFAITVLSVVTLGVRPQRRHNRTLEPHAYANPKGQCCNTW
jgi:hypothetical protein